MGKIIFDIQRFAGVIAGKLGNDKLVVATNRTQVYGLTGNDTLESNGKNDVLLIGGSGNDVLKMTGGNGTLSGGKGSDTFNLSYSASKKISAVIEDIDPTSDKIVITYDGKTAPQLSYSISGKDVICSDDDGNFNVTLKGSSDASDYFDGTAHEYIWEILRLVNQEREKENLDWLTLSQALTDGAMIRSREIISKYEHVRPDGSSCFTAVEKSYNSMGENIYSSPTSPQAAMEGWMNSPGHRANILNSSFKKLGVGYTYDGNSQWKYHWVQMFGGNLSSSDSISTDKILTTSMTLNGKKISLTAGAEGISLDNENDSVVMNGSDGNDLLINGRYWADERGGHFVTISGGKGNDTITSHGSNALIDSGSGHDVIYNGYRYYQPWDYFYDPDDDNYKGNNSTISGGAGNDSIKNKGDNVLFKYASGDGNDFIEGFNNSSTLNISSSYSTVKSGSNVIVTVGEGKITLEGAANLSTVNISKTTSGGSTTSTLKAVTNSTKSPVTVSSAIKTIDASKRTTAVKITGNALANLIKGGSGNDTLNGAKGNDTLTGGKGKDIFISGTGKDVITDYETGDKISMTAAITKTTVSGSNVVFTMGKNSLTVKNAKGKSLSLTTSAGKNLSTIVGGSTTLTVTNSTKSPVTVGSAIKTINASKRTIAIKITGNSLANTIKGGSKNDSLYGAAGNDSILGNAGNDKIYGGKGNDTLTGGKGNGSLWGEAGKDKFIYSSGDGKDVIYGFANDDILKITGAFSTSRNKSKKEVYFKVGSTSNAITLKNFTATSFNINGTSYKLGSSKLVKR